MESGLVSLRAELHRKKSQANKSVVDGVCRPTENKKSLLKNPRSLNKKKECIKNTKPTEDITVDNEELLKLEKSRKSLEEKAALYEKIKNGTEVLEDDDLNQKFLINFQEKIYKEVSRAKEKRERDDETTTPQSKNFEPCANKPSSEEWVEYTDKFGRTRICLQKDLEYLSKKVESCPSLAKPSSKVFEKWDKIEDESKTKTELHYQDVLFDEARSHGASFMPFSRDEKERNAQQQLLKDFGTQIDKTKRSKEILARNRNKLMNERLAKVRQKKRLKMGLPIKDDELKTPPPSDEEDDSKTLEQSEESAAVSSLKSKDESSDCEKKPTTVREWDIGKPGVASTLSQEQWIQSRRKVRENEFAPPTNYDWESNSKKPHQEFKDSSYGNYSSKSSMEAERFERRSSFAPPPTFDYNRPTSTRKTFSLRNTVDVEAAITKGLSQLRKEFTGT